MRASVVEESKTAISGRLQQVGLSEAPKWRILRKDYL